MAFSNRPDYVFNSAALRNLPPEFVANTHLDYVLQNDRLKTFLSRNRTCVTDDQKRRAKQAQTAAKPKQTKANSITSAHGHLDDHVTGPSIATQVNGMSRSVLTTATEETLFEHDTSMPTDEAMSRQTLRNKHKGDPWDPSKRKSIRTQSRKQYEDPTASLVVGMHNMRKKLNWKETKTAREVPARKKPRLEPIECDAYLAIWDNSGPTTSKMPLLSKREFCELVKIKRDADPVRGEFVEIKLDEPFIITHKELRVAANNGKERMALAKEYFMEIKITPRDEKVPWPPIPMLGKSDGERFNGMGTDAKDEINTSLIARYQHLPIAPEADIPLSIFVYAEGRTFRTKYGLEVSAGWVPKNHPDLVRKPTPEPDLPAWALDDGKHPFGRVDPNRKPVSHAARKSAVPNKKLAQKTPRVPKITYHIHVAKGAKTDFNKFSVRGLKCYSCSGKSFDNLLELRLHLDQNHKNRVTVQSEEKDLSDGRLLSATIRIETPSNQSLKAPQGNHNEEADKIINYFVPDVPFDLSSHYTGKKTPWTEVLPAQLSKEAVKGPSILPTASDTQSIIRRENKGHVPYQQVLPFRPQEFQRKKFPNKKLLTKHVSLENPYTSISHRPIYFDNDEDARSETDDEVEDPWFVDRHMEELDIHSWRENWSDARRRLAKRWDRHVLDRERGISARYIGDCLIRFVRIEKRWILREDMKSDDPIAFSTAQTESFLALVEMMEDLKNMKVINENVCTDVITMLYSDDELEIPVEEQREIEAQIEDTTKRRENVRRQNKSAYKKHTTAPADPEVPMLPLTTCAECHLEIGYNKQRAVRCSNLRCSTPNIWYHAKCAGLSLVEQDLPEGFSSTPAVVVNDFIKRRLTWKCRKCMDVKGKERAIPLFPNLTQVGFLANNDEAAVRSTTADEETSEIAAEDALSRSKSSSVAPSVQPDPARSVPYNFVQDALESREAKYTTWVDDRRSLRGIIAHHYHVSVSNGDTCIYAVIDERPSRSRSKRPHTVLAISQNYDHKSEPKTHRILVRYPDSSNKRDSENWSLFDRDFESEVVARFRPYKVQHYLDARYCRTVPLSKQTHSDKRLNEELYGGEGRLPKEPGRGFFYTEQNNPGTVWAGDYFDEIQKIIELDQKMGCKDLTHRRCSHSITAKGDRYKSFAKVEGIPWWPE